MNKPGSSVNWTAGYKKVNSSARRARTNLSKFSNSLPPRWHINCISPVLKRRKEMKYIFSIILLSAVFVSGCFYGYTPLVEVTKINPAVQYPPKDSVAVFWEDGAAFQKNYQQIAFIEVQGDAYADKSALLPLLIKEAAKAGADAVINVKHSYVTRYSGEALTSIVSGQDNSHEYIATALTGVAVKFN